MKLFKKKRTNRILSLIIAIVISAVNMTVMSAAADENIPVTYSEGEADLTISTADELRAFRDEVNNGDDYSGKTVALANDLDMGGEEWEPIAGDGSIYFNGTFDGGGHEITGLKITTVETLPYNYAGLFGRTGSNVEIKNLGVDIYINVEQPGNYNIYAGGIVGSNYGIITNCYSTGNISATSVYSNWAGGIAGNNGNGGRITNCYNLGDISSTVTASSGNAGGIAGENRSTISNCYSTGDINCTASSTPYTGGITGKNQSGSPQVTNCYYLEGTAPGGINSGDVTGQAEVKSADAFASGEVTYLLNGDQSEINWYQTIGTDTLPTLDSTHQTVLISNETYYNFVTSIRDAGDLKALRYSVNEGIADYSGVTVTLENDIDLENVSWEPIGWDKGSLGYAVFCGIFEGNGHKITGLNVTSSRDNTYYGLFGVTNGGGIKNLEVDGKINIDAPANAAISIGGIVGRMGLTYSTYVTNCSFKGSIEVSGSPDAINVGGITGYLDRSSTVNNCWSNAEITDKSSAMIKYIGGIVGGQIINTSINNSYCLGTDTVTKVSGSWGAMVNSAVVEEANFKSGKVAYDINANDGVEAPVWYQNIDIIPEGGTADSYPTLNSNHNAVYKLASVYTNERVAIAASAAANAQSTKDYNAGDEFEVSINAASMADDYTSVQFTLDYDHDKLEIAENGVSTNLQGGDFKFNNDIFAYTITGATPISLGETATEIAKVKFKVKTDITGGETAIGLKECELMPTDGEAFTPISAGDTVTLHNITVTLNGGNGTITFNNTAYDNGLTLYGKYNKIGLYSDAARSTSVSADGISVSANTGYRLANGITEPLWIGGTADNLVIFGDTAALLAGTFTESKTLTLQTVRQYTVTIAEAENGRYNTDAVDPIVVDTGTAYSSLNLPGFTANENYTSAGWYIKGETDTPVDMVNGTVTGDVTIYAKAVESQYDFASSSENCGISVTSGVTDDKAQYNTDVVFNITNVNSGYAITGVYYSVNNGTPVAATYVSGTTYKVPGANITGNISVTASASPYYTLTFEEGNSTFAQGDSTTAYVISGVGGMYASYDSTTMRLTGTFTLPVPTANDGYRLLNGTGEYLWADGNNNRYTNATLAEASFTGDTVITVQTIARYTVAFIAGSNGSLEGNTAITVDAGHTLRASDIPTPVPDRGYVFTDWSGSETIVGDEITGDVTYTANFTHGIYNVTNGSRDIADIAFESGIEYDQATHGTDVTFRVSKADEDDNYEIIKVMYSIAGDNEHQNVELTAENGVYTIPGNVITGDVTITVSSQNTVTLTFSSADTSTGTVSGTTVFTILTGNTLGETNFAKVVVNANKGYSFSRWELGNSIVTEDQIVNTIIDDTLSGAAVEYKAVFDHGRYDVASEDVSLVDAEGNAVTQAVHGTDLTFTPVKDNYLVINIRVTIDGEEYTSLVNNGDGSYTISGNDITGDISVSADTFEWNGEGSGIIEFISEQDYKALGENTKIALVNIDNLDNLKPMYRDKEFYRSDKYNAFVMIVDAGVTAEDIANGITLAEGTAQSIDYSGDLNGSGSNTAADAGIINELIYKLRTAPTDMQRFMADIWESSDSEEDMSIKSVTASDVLSALRKAVGLE